MIGRKALRGAKFTQLTEVDLEKDPPLQDGLAVVFHSDGQLRHVGYYEGGKSISALDLYPARRSGMFLQGRKMRSGESYDRGSIESLNPWSDNEGARASSKTFEGWAKQYVEAVLKASGMDLEPTREAEHGEDISAVIEQMHSLVNECYEAFQQGTLPSLVARAEKAALLERVLLEYCQRGEMTASALYLAALRDRKEFTVAADWARKVTADRHLLAQCLRDFAGSTKNAINNALGALRDSQRPEDLAYALELEAFVKTVPAV